MTTLSSLGITPEAARKRTLEFQRDPVAWNRVVLGAEMWETQRILAEAVRDYERVAVRSCHSSGKTWWAAHIALWFLYSFPNSRVLTTAPVFRQVRENLWGEMQKAYEGARYPLGAETKSWLQCRLVLGGMWNALGFATDKMERFSGFHAPYILVLVDEASGVSEAVFEAIEGLLASGRMVRLVMISQGTQVTGTFHRAFHADRAAHSLHSIAAADTPNFDPDVLAAWREAGSPMTGYAWPSPHLINPAWAEGRRIAWGENSPLYMVKVKGEFAPSDPYAMFSLGDCEYCAEHVIRDVDPTPEMIGVDVARTGVDQTVLFARRGPKVLRCLSANITLGPDVEAMCVEMHRLTGIKRFTYDADGIGGPIADYVRRNHPDWEVIDFHSNASPTRRTREHLRDARAVAYTGLADRLRDRDCDMTALSPEHREELIADLTVIRKELNPRGQVFVERKEEMKKRLGRSPDFADALMLAFSPAKSGPPLFTPVTMARTSPWR